MIFDKNGFATASGWVFAHCIDRATGEFLYSQDVYVSVGTTLPAGAYLDEPPPPQPGKAILRQGAAWLLVDDYRGQTAYDKADRRPITVMNPGELPDELTLQQPGSAFDIWDEAHSAWVKNTEAEQAWQLQQAEAQRNMLMAEATQQIAILADAVELGMATEEEQAAYTAWRQYRVQLSRLDLATPPIQWPPKPSTII
ncbi:tail fiber assembly protein [Aeromonas caviae]